MLDEEGGRSPEPWRLRSLTGAASPNPRRTCCTNGPKAPTPRPSPSSAKCSPPPAASGSRRSIAGHTANTLAKLRADVVAGNAPPAVQLKGPEIAEWNATGMTANLDDLANKEGWDKVVAPELLPVMKPTGHWVAAPMNIHRINWIWGSTKAMEQAGIKDAAEDLGRIQRRLRQGDRRASSSASPISARTGPTRRRSKSSSTDRTSTCSARLSSRATPKRCARPAWSRRSSRCA